MPRVRGKTSGAYDTDGGTHYNMEVDSDRFIEVGFAWTAGAPGGPLMPRGFKPRHVTGLSAGSGRRGTAVVPHLTSTLWTGVATVFTVEADDGTLDTMTVKHRIAERPSLP